jgi:hypothetical protein
LLRLPGSAALLPNCVNKNLPVVTSVVKTSKIIWLPLLTSGNLVTSPSLLLPLPKFKSLPLLYYFHFQNLNHFHFFITSTSKI